MVLYIAVVMIVSFFEIKSMTRKNLRREVIVFIGFSLFTALIGCIYFYNPYRQSIVNFILTLVKG